MGGKPNVDLLEGTKYEKIKDLNSGTFGFVQLARNTQTGEKVAIKFLERGDKITKYVLREIQNHRLLMHPHIIMFKEVFLVNHFLAIAMEYAEGGDMFEHVVKKGGLKEDEARWFFQQLIVAVDYCHKVGIVNRDIKLENTLLDKSPMPLLKLCDFGYSKNTNTMSAPKSKVGTPGYIAPEVIKQKQYDGQRADVWSCGVMLYVMLAGAYPFERPEDKNDPNRMEKLLNRIMNVEYSFPPHVRISEICRDLVSKILVASPKERLDLKQVMDHPWFMINLPEGVKEMNEQRFAPPGTQSNEEIQRIVSQAMASKTQLTPDVDYELDNYADEEPDY